jgi:tRNA(Ile)-lysidine synthase
MNPRNFPTAPFPSSAKLVVGVSGGSDSLALLSLLKENRSYPSKKLIVAHVNYGLRGRSSMDEEKHVKEIASQWGLPWRVLKVKGGKKPGYSLQDWAREVRFGFFTSVVKKEKAWGVAVAHQLEDQAETILDRLLRGAGPRGLSGLRPVQELRVGPRNILKIWRPLLAFSKTELKDYLKSRGISWKEDLSNAQTYYRRNQIRHEIIPFLTRWNVDLIRKLAQTGEILASEDAWLDGWVDGMGLQLIIRKGRSRWTLSLSQFKALALPIQRRVVRRVLEGLEPRARGLSFERVEETLEIWTLRKQGPRDLGFGLSVGSVDQEIYARKS